MLSQEIVAYGILVVLTVIVLAVWWAVGFLLRRASNPRVFISYRKADGKETADRIWGDLAKRYGQANVFMDDFGLQAGDEYPHVLAGWLSASDVVVAVVTKSWDGRPAGSGKPRLLETYDWVRREVEHGNKNGIIIARVDDTLVPKYQEGELEHWQAAEENLLLESLRKKQSVRIDSDVKKYRAGLADLAQAIDRRHRRFNRWLLQGWWYGVPTIVLLSAVLAGWWVHSVHAHIDRVLSKVVGDVDALKIQVDGLATTQRNETARIDAEAKAIREEIKPLRPDLTYPLDAFIDLAVKGRNLTVAQYQQKTVVWQGQVTRTFVATSGITLVYLQPESAKEDGVKVTASFPPENLPNDVRAFLDQKKPAIKFSGRVHSVTANEITVKDCRLLPGSL